MLLNVARLIIFVLLYITFLMSLVPHGYRASVTWGACAVFTFYLGFIRPLYRELPSRQETQD